ncbi:unnamed protein product [Meloidogyne enterolobii]|uniref:Uncharacterized protein n=1 Tax=Meloidogyne enterolobii TaxID=390850 RepID=A0ACB1AUB9_MELEN
MAFHFWRSTRSPDFYVFLKLFFDNYFLFSLFLIIYEGYFLGVSNPVEKEINIFI